MRKFQRQFLALKESTAKGFLKRIEQELKEAKRKKIKPKESLPKYRNPTVWPLLLSSLNSMVQKYLFAASNQLKLVIKALMKRHPNIVGNVDLDSSLWTQSLFRHMGLVTH